MEDCVFCRMVAGEIPAAKIYEDDAVLAFLDIGPISDGHTLVIPKQHFGRMHDCDPDVLGKIGPCLGKIAAAVVVGMEAEGYNVLCNNGRVAGQVVEHLHFHIIPRWANDGVFKQWPAYKYQEGRIGEIAEKICRSLT